MPELSELSDWIWFIAVALWVLTRVLPRLLRSRSKTASPPAARQPRAARQRHQRYSVPKAPDQQPDPDAEKRIQSPAPIEPH